MYRVAPFLNHFAISLILGTLSATLWVTLSPSGYYDFIEWRIIDVALPDWLWHGNTALTPQGIVMQGLMSVFVFVMGKELWEAVVLKRGALSGRNWIVPLSGIIGASVSAGMVWYLFATSRPLPDGSNLSSGWPIPIGSDILIAYVFGLLVFGRAHHALHMLLLICIATDLLALLALGLSQPAVTYLNFGWLLVPALASFLAWNFYGSPVALKSSNRANSAERLRRRRLVLWPYVIAGAVSFWGVSKAGLPPSLGLLPIIPAIQHADRAFGIFADAEGLLHDPLNRFAHVLVNPIIVILFLFGLTAGGLDFGAYSATTNLVLICAWFAKPFGFLIAVSLAIMVMGRYLPNQLSKTDIVKLAFLSGISFTIPVLGLVAVLPGGEETEAARLGLAASSLVGAVVFAASRFVKFWG